MNKPPKIIFKHLGVREATHDRFEAARLAYAERVGHKVSMAEYMDLRSKQPFHTDHKT